MRVVACLAWYDEPPESLTRCVRSLAGIADTLVAIDGPWEGFPSTRLHSTLDEGLAIHEAARLAGIQLDLRTSQAVWPSQVKKRDHLMRAASELGDWLLVIDADEWLDVPQIDISTLSAKQTIDGQQDFALVRDVLEFTPLDVATVELHEGQHHAPIRRIYRAPVTVQRSHHGYRTSDGRWLHGPPDHVTLEPAIATPIQLHHDRSARSNERAGAAIAYRQHRVRNQTELWT